MFHRSFNYPKNNSFFIFGARGTGKTSALKTHFNSKQALWIDLLSDETLDELRRRPSLLKSKYESFKAQNHSQWVVIDEIQRLPKLLNEVHQLIESEGALFALTGSSARKIKRGAANLLAGRAFVQYLFPLTFLELGKSFSIQDVLNWGSLPKIFSLPVDDDKIKFLRSYSLTYLREEILQEQVVRKLDPFREFLEVAAQMNGKQLNYSSIAKSAGVDSKTVSTYYQILEDTWMGFKLPAFHRSVRKAQKLSPKFYWFDVGVKRALENALDSPPVQSTSYYGECFEHLVMAEAFRLNHYSGKEFRMSYLATQNSAVEIDLILEKSRGAKPIAIEIKSAKQIDETKVKKLAHTAQSLGAQSIYYLSQDPENFEIDGVQCLPWQKGLLQIFGIKAPNPLL